MSTLVVSNINDGTTTVPATYVTNGSAKAWVNFNGTGTIAARDSFNLSSLTDNGTGQYTVSLSAAMASADYCWQVNAQDVNNGMGVPTAQADPTRTVTSSGLPVIYNYPPDISFYDAFAVTIALHGDLA